MDLVVSWLLFPALAFGLWSGCGLLLEAVLGTRLPGALVPAVGFAAVVVLGQAMTVADATAEWATPAVVVLALAGLALGARARRLPDPIALLLAVTLVLVVGAPVLLSGEATFAGFIKLDDTATWLALTDRILEHGRSLDGLAPSTYEATLFFNLGDGYPIGVFVPFGIAAKLAGLDPAWAIQPYIATLAAILGLALWQLAAVVADAPWTRFGAAFIGAQPALLVGYGLWGGVKEVAAAALLAAAVAATLWALEQPREARRLLAPTLLAAALVGVLSGGGLIWLAPLALYATAALAGRLGPRAAAVRLGIAGAGLVALSLPAIVPGGLLPPTSSPLTADAAQGNLIGPLDPAQVAGIWPVGDFRLSPDADGLVLIAVAVTTAAALLAALWWARRRRPGPALLLISSLWGAVALLVLGSPWVAGKALATASAAIPFAAMLAVGLLARGGARIAAGGLALLVAGGVLWSNALAFRDVNLAPRAQLSELEGIGELIAGEGPTLITEYSPFAARHFLRDADAESISELRRRRIPLRNGALVAKGLSADTDEVDPAALGAFRTLVIRRSPAASRPPSQFRLLWAGETYEVWQRPRSAPAAAARLPLGDRWDPVARPRCRRIAALARGAPPGARLIAARRPGTLVVPLSQTRYPSRWRRDYPASAPVPSTPGTILATVHIAREGAYEIWLGGSLRPRVELLIDGEPAGEVRHQLNNAGGYVSLGRATLVPGSHRIQVSFAGPDLHPGSGGRADQIGPLSLATATARDARLVRMRAGAALARLCARSWDWVELRPPAT